MADNEQPEPADLSPLADDLTLTQLQARRAPVAAELDHLVKHGDRTAAVSRRVRELRAFLTLADDMIAEIQGTTFEPAPAPAPEPEPQPQPVSEPVVAEDPEPAPEPEPEAHPADPDDNGNDGPEPPGIATMTDDQIEQAMARLQSELAGRVEPIGEGTGTAPIAMADAKPEPGSRIGGAPIFATAGAGQFEHVNVEGPTTIAGVGQKMRSIQKMAHLIPGDAPLRFNLYRADKLADVDPDGTLPRLGEDADENTRLLFHEPQETVMPDSIAAAADLHICGDPVEVNVRGSELDSTTPFLNAIAGNSIAATNCVVRWRRPLSVEQVNPGPQLWTTTQQAAVDPADRTTWKPIAGDLPPCDDFCTAEPFDTVLGLGVTLNDMTCRPERIDEMNRWIEVLHAILLEQTAMSIFDLQVGAQHHLSFDASALAQAGDPATGAIERPQLGAIPALQYAVHALLSRTGMDRHSPTQGWWAAVHPSIFHTLALDAGLAEENGSGLERLTSILQAAGVERVVVLKDFGACEGILAAGYSGNAFLCNLENADVPTYNNPATGCVSFGGGVNLPPMVTDTRIRLFQPQNWWHGSTFLVDYALHTSAELMRQNRAEYFGERRDLLFKASNANSIEFVLDVSNLHATGQRVERLGLMPAPNPIAGGTGNPPLVPGLSQIGAPNPQQLADQTDPDPATTPQRTGVGGTNPDPGTPPGTQVPGGSPVV